MNKTNKIDIEDDTPLLFLILYYLIGFVFYMLMFGVYIFSITQIDTLVYRIIYIIITICILVWIVYILFRYPQ